MNVKFVLLPVSQLSLKGGCESLDDVKDSLGLIFLWMEESVLHRDSQGWHFLLIPSDCSLPSARPCPASQHRKYPFNCVSNLSTDFPRVLNQITLQTLCLVMCLTQHLHTKLPNEHVQLWQLDM